MFSHGILCFIYIDPKPNQRKYFRPSTHMNELLVYGLPVSIQRKVYYDTVYGKMDDLMKKAVLYRCGQVTV